VIRSKCTYNIRMPVARFARYYRANWVPGIPTIGHIPYGHRLQYTSTEDSRYTQR